MRSGWNSRMAARAAAAAKEASRYSILFSPRRSCAAAERTGTWYGMEPEAAVGTLQHKKNPRRDGAGVSKSTVLRAGLTGLEPATSGVTDRHSNQLSYSPKPPRGAPEYRPGVRSIQR